MHTLKNTSFDAIVVGSGPGGAAVTHELSKHGKRVLVLEKGSGDKIKKMGSSLCLTLDGKVKEKS